MSRTVLNFTWSFLAPPPLVFTVEIKPENITLPAGSTAVWKCRVRPAAYLGQEIPGLDWYKDGGGTIPVGRVRVESLGRRMQIADVVRGQDDGIYVCSASDGRVTKTATTVLKVIGCTDDEFTCSDGSCIDSKLRCDKRDDCPGGEDELDCRK